MVERRKSAFRPSGWLASCWSHLLSEQGFSCAAASGAIQTQCQVRGQNFRMLWPVVWSNFVFAHSVTTLRTGSEDLLDGTILSASPNGCTPAHLALEETNILKYLTGDTAAFADASVDWQRVFAIRRRTSRFPECDEWQAGTSTG